MVKLKEPTDSHQEDELFLSHSDASKEKFFILACKHNRVEILKHIFGTSSTKVFKDVPTLADKDVISPDDTDESSHNAFYYAIRSSNVELLDVLIRKWPGNYFDTRSEKLDELLSRAYEELKLKNVLLSDEMEIFVESELINLRFFSNVPGQLQSSTERLRCIIERIDLVIRNIASLKSEYSNDEKVDAKFLCIGRFIAQNIHVLKRQLKLTYDRLPWEEIEFCLVAFVSSYVKPQEINLYYRSVLDKSKILLYLDEFAKKLDAEKSFIKSQSVAKLTDLPKLKRDEVVAQIIRNDPQFSGLYNDHEQIRDIYSMEVVRDYLNLALSVKPDEKEGQLIIIRALQVIGEYLKNTLESPKLSTTTSELLLLSLPQNTRKVIIDLRNSLSHAYSLSKRTEIEENTNAEFFSGIQSDVKRIDNVIIDILYANKMKMIEEMLEKIITSDNLHEVRSIAEVLKHVNFNTGTVPCNFEMTELERLRKFVKDLDNAIPNQVNLEKELFIKANSMIDGMKNKSENIRLDYGGIFQRLKSVSLFSYDDLNQDGIDTVKRIANKILHNLVAQVPFHSYHNIVEVLTRIVQNAKPRLQKDIDVFDSVIGLTCEILLTLRIKMNDTKWIERLREKLYGNTSFTCVSHQSKSQGVTGNKYDQQLTNKIFELKNILKKDPSGGKLIDYKRNEKLRAVVEMLVLDIMSILSTSHKHLENNHFFLDDNSPLLTGKCLRNHLAHGNTLLEVLLSDPSLAVVLNAEKLVSENIVQSGKKVGKLMPDDPTKLSLKHDHDLVAITNQENMFAALVKGDLNELKSCIAKGADILGRSNDSSTTLHFAAQAPTLSVAKFVVDHSSSSSVADKNADGQTPLHVASAYGKTNVVKFFLSQASAAVNDKDRRGRTPLHIAAKNGHKNIVELLLKNNADTDIHDYSGYAAVHHAVRFNRIEVAKILLNKEPHVDMNEAHGGFTPLHVATTYGHTELVEFLLKNGANPNTKDDEGTTPLHTAAYYGHLKIANALILKKAQVNARKLNGWTPLFDAVEKGHADVVNALLKHKADVDARDKIYGHSPLHLAAINGSEEIVEILLKNKAEILAINKADVIPLHYAAESGHLRVVELLIKHSSNPNVIHVRDTAGATALHYAAQNGHTEVVEFFVRNGIDVNDYSFTFDTPLHLASLAGHENIVEFLIKNKATVDQRNAQENTALFLAVQHECKAVVDVLLKNKAQVNLKCVEGFTPLHKAALNGNYDIAAVLVKHRADVNAKSDSGLLPLQAACLNGQKQIVELLVKNKAKVNLSSETGVPLCIAVEGGHKEVVEILIANGANVNLKFDGLTPIKYAIRSNRKEIVEILAANGANVNEPQAEPLSMAVDNGNKDIVDILLKYNARVNVKNCENDTPLHMAAHRGYTEIAKSLISKGADVNAVTTTVDRTAPIHLAAWEGHLEVIKILVENGAKVNVENVAGYPLHITASQGKTELVEFLLSKGAKLIKDDKGKTPFEVAAGGGHLQVIKVLLQNKKIDLNASGINDYTLLHIACEAKNLELIKYLVDIGSDINAKIPNGLKPIHFAARKNFLEAVEFFLAKGVDINEPGPFNQPPLFFALANDYVELIEYLVANGADVNLKSIYGSTLVHTAAEFGSKRSLEILLQKGAAYNALDGLSKSPLEIARLRAVDSSDDKSMKNKVEVTGVLSSIAKLFDAVKRNCPSEAEKAIKAGAFVNAKDTNTMTPLHYAAWKGFEETLRILLKNHADINLASLDGSTALHFAAAYSNLGCLKILMQHGAIYNSPSLIGTPLQLANNKDIIDLFQKIDNLFERIKKNDAGVIKDLNEVKDCDMLKAIMNARNSENKSLIAAAIQSNFSKIDDLKQVSQSDVSTKRNEAVLRILKGDYQNGMAALNRLYEKRKQILGPDNPATLEIQVEIATGLFEQGYYQAALKMFQEVQGKQEEALGSSDEEAMRTKGLIAVTLHRLGKEDEALSMFEKVNQQMEAVLGANHENAVDSRFNTALVLNKLGRHEEALKINKEVFELRKNTLGMNTKPTISAQNNLALTLYYLGKHEDALELFREVLQKKLSALGSTHVETLRTMNNIANIFVAQNKYQDALNVYDEVLRIQKESLPRNHPETLNTQYNIAGVYFNQAKFISAFKVYKECYDQRVAFFGPNHPTVMEIDIKMRTLINLQFKYDGVDASNVLKCLQKDINVACSNGDIKTVERFLKGGANVNDQDVDGRTPLHYAVNNGHLGMVNLLLRYEADVTVFTNKGNSPLHTAASKNYKEIAEALLQNINRDKLHEFVDAKTATGGTTSLHVATKGGYLKIVKLLLQHGATYDISNNEGKTPIDLAKDQKIIELFKFIEEIFEGTKKGEVEVIDKLKALKIDERSVVTNARNCEEYGLLQVAIVNKRKKIADALLAMLRESN